MFIFGSRNGVTRYVRILLSYFKYVSCEFDQCKGRYSSLFGFPNLELLV